MTDYEKMLEIYENAEGDPGIFKDSDTAHLVIHKNRVMGAHLVEGLSLTPEETENGVDLVLELADNVIIPKEVHLCFGVLPEEGLQEINLKAVIGSNSGIKLLAHCVFPNAAKVRHVMNGEIRIKENSCYEYMEVHFHGEKGGIEVVPRVNVYIGARSSFKTSFDLIKGRVGKFDLSYDVEAAEEASVEMTARINGSGDDHIKLSETARLKGENSRGLIKSRVAVRDEAETEIINEMAASAAGATGHVDCVEIMQGNAKARAVPIVNVQHELAKITHEAAIGSVDRKKVETLMSRGVDKEEAVNIIIGGMFK